MIDGPLAPVEADHVIGGREYDPPDALPPRRLEHVVAADDVVVQDRLPGVLDRAGAEMDDAVDARAQALDRGRIGEVGPDELLARLGLQVDHVRQAQARIDAAQQRPDPPPDAARSTGDQHSLHAAPPSGHKVYVASARVLFERQQPGDRVQEGAHLRTFQADRLQAVRHGIAHLQRLLQ